MSSKRESLFQETQRLRLGDYIQRSTVNNRDLKYGVEYIVGVSNDGKFTAPKGNPTNVDLKPYKIVSNGAFVYNPSRLDLGSIAYRTDGLCIVSHLYVVFYLNEQGRRRIIPEYLFMYLRRKEFYREVSFRNFGSQRPEFNFHDISEILIPLPDISIQQKYVSVYNAMLANQRVYKSGLEDLKLTCDAYIDKLRHELPHEAIGNYITQIDARNTIGLQVDAVRGLAVSKGIIPTKAKMKGVSLTNYKVVPSGAIAYVSDTSRRGDKMSLGYNNTDEPFLVSSISTVFSTDKDVLLPEYLMLFFCRSEFDRYSRFHSWGSARETFNWSDMCDVKIPVPDIKIQQYIVNIYTVYQLRREINEQLKAQIKDICPILIKGSIEEATNA
ncbi:restriction endonuclease subunit S [Emergencia sp.]|uniref:restriction endonuclease subunit S n=1 Tax=Emergencia sp. TaxID=1926557 RepID=UPI003AF067CA